MVNIRKISVIIGLSVLFIILLAAIADAVLTVQDFELSSLDVDDEVKPGEVLEISFDIVNGGNEDYEDVDVEMWFEKSGTKLEDNSGNNIKITFNLRDIDEGKDKPASYDLITPWEVNNGERYDILMKIKGKNTNTSLRETLESTVGTFKITKLNHDIFMNTSFNPASVDCSKYVNLFVSLRNIGKDDEDDINLTAVNKVVGVDIKEFLYLDNNPSEDDNLFEKTYPFTIKPDVNPGVYEVSVSARYDNGYEEASKTVNLTVKSCDNVQQPTTPQQPASTTPEQQTTTQPPVANYTPSQPTTQPSTNYVPAQPTGAKPKQAGTSNSLIMWIVAGEIGLVIIILLVYLIVRGRRQKPTQPQF